MMRSWSAATLPEQTSHAEVLRYLGYRGQELTPTVRACVDEMDARCEEVARPEAIWESFSPATVNLPGTDIARHLANAVAVVLMAVTLGHGIDRELRKLSLVDPFRQLVFDAAATAAVERLADKTEAAIRAAAWERGLYCDWRFSPGYGDLPLEVQSDLLTRLNATRRLGITLTESNLMIPTKSVTAIVGFHTTPQPGLASSCDVCALSPHCALRERGTSCRAPVQMPLSRALQAAESV